MAEDSNAFQTFIADLQFIVDEQSLQHFHNALQAASVQLGQVGDALSQFETSLGASGESSTQAARNTDTFTVSLRSLVAMVTRAVAAIGALKLIDDDSTLLNLSQRTQLSVDYIRAMGYAAQMTGADISALESSLEQLNLRGIDLQYAREKLLPLNSRQRMWAAQNMGIDASLIPMLTSDTSGLVQEWQQMQSAFGMSAEQIAKTMRKLYMEFNRFKTMFSILSRSILAAVGETFLPVLRKLNELMQHVSSLRAVFDFIGPVVAKVLQIIVGSIIAAARTISYFIDLLSKLNDKTDGTLKKIAQFGAGIAIFARAMLASPLFRTLAMLAAAFLLIEDYIGWRTGKWAYLDWSKMHGFFDNIKEGAIGIKDAFAEAFSGIKSAIGTILEDMKQLASLTLDALAAQFDRLKQAVLGVVNTLKEMWTAFTKFVGYDSHKDARLDDATTFLQDWMHPLDNAAMEEYARQFAKTMGLGEATISRISDTLYRLTTSSGWEGLSSLTDKDNQLVVYDDTTSREDAERGLGGTIYDAYQFTQDGAVAQRLSGMFNARNAYKVIPSGRTQEVSIIQNNEITINAQEPADKLSPRTAETMNRWAVGNLQTPLVGVVEASR